MSEQEFAKARSVGKRQKVKPDTFTLSKRSWFHLGHDRKIHIVNQRFGGQCVGQVSLTRAEFQQFCRFYERANQQQER